MADTDFLNTDSFSTDLSNSELTGGDLIRSATAFVASLFASVVATALLWHPQVALATGGGGGGSVGTGGPTPGVGIQDAINSVLDFVTGPTATAVGMIAMIGVLIGVVVRSQRGESITGLASVAAALLVILNIENLITFLGATAGAGM